LYRIANVPKKTAASIFRIALKMEEINVSETLDSPYQTTGLSSNGNVVTAYKNHVINTRLWTGGKPPHLNASKTKTRVGTHDNSVSASQRTKCVSITKTHQLILLTDITFVWCANHAKQNDTHSAQKFRDA
jgi:hypothetical protein